MRSHSLIYFFISHSDDRLSKPVKNPTSFETKIDKTNFVIEIISIMPTPEAILTELKHGFNFLRRDGLFLKGTVLGEDLLLLESTTYITDTDDGKDIDCLCVYEDELGLGGSCVCEDITTGTWLKEGSEPPLGSVACPVCQRLARPRTLKKRCYSITVRVHDEHLSLLNSQPNENLKAMPTPMSDKIIGICNAIFPVWTYG